ncbi:MAG TPA: hypothetical protein VLB80_00080 [Candidatus Babeliales bacterium]|nr:hypothetical protein [Candidatus Babeliales bacterium]
MIFLYFIIFTFFTTVNYYTYSAQKPIDVIHSPNQNYNLTRENDDIFFKSLDSKQKELTSVNTQREINAQLIFEASQFSPDSTKILLRIKDSNDYIILDNKFEIITGWSGLQGNAYLTNKHLLIEYNQQNNPLSKQNLFLIKNIEILQKNPSTIQDILNDVRTIDPKHLPQDSVRFVLENHLAYAFNPNDRNDAIWCKKSVSNNTIDVILTNIDNDKNTTLTTLPTDAELSIEITITYNLTDKCFSLIQEAKNIENQTVFYADNRFKIDSLTNKYIHDPHIPYNPDLFKNISRKQSTKPDTVNSSTSTINKSPILDTYQTWLKCLGITGCIAIVFLLYRYIQR